jgi:hypothetical protein
MSFIPYAAILLAGMALSFVPQPTNLLGRYAGGLAAAPLGFGLLTIAGDLLSA